MKAESGKEIRVFDQKARCGRCCIQLLICRDPCHVARTQSEPPRVIDSWFSQDRPNFVSRSCRRERLDKVYRRGTRSSEG